MSKFTGLTLFAGVGASSKAVRDRGGHVVAAVEREEPMLASLRLNGFPAYGADVRQVDFRRFGHVDAILGGPPCQPFSQATDNDGRFDPRDMIPEFLRAVAELLPSIFVMEEVKTLTWAKHRDYLEHVEECFRALGYHVEHRVINAADYGVPQTRQRLFVVGVRVDVADGVRWPEPWFAGGHVTMAAALGWDDTECYLRNQAAPGPARVSIDSDAHLWPLHRASTTVVGSFRPDVQAAPGYRKAGDGPRQNTPGSVVTTLEERLVLQGLPRDWQVSPSKADLQVGNSCPPIVLASILAVNGF